MCIRIVHLKTGKIVDTDQVPNALLKEKAKSLGYDKVWMPGEKDYVSINGYTLKAHKDLDFPKFRDSGFLIYLDTLDIEGEDRPYKPHRGGVVSWPLSSLLNVKRTHE